MKIGETRATMTHTIDQQLDLITRGCVELISDAELRKKLAEGRPLRIKAGFDPTAPDLHLGHTVLLQKLRQFQELGHQVIFLIGDYTAKVGDPSGRSSTRPQLTDAEIAANVQTYQDQVFKILDRQKTEVRFNSEWLGKMTPSEFLTLASKYTVARMLERDDFKKRLAEGNEISILELLYPLMQGYDSVALRADVELGGQDQKFNLVVARAMQRRHDQAEEIILTMPLLVGLDGEKKMSKSYGNHIAIQDPPNEMFGKLMSIPDTLMWDYFTLLSDKSTDDIHALRAGHPRTAKVALAQEIVARFHSPDAATAAIEEFERIFVKKDAPSNVPVVTLAPRADGYALVDVLTEHALTASKGEARRLIAQGAVKIDGTVITDIALRLAAAESTIQVGKRRFVKVLIGSGNS